MPQQLAKQLVRISILLAIGTCGSLGWSQDDVAELITADGARRDVRLIGLNPQGQVVLRWDDRDHNLAIDEFVRFGFPVEDTSDPWIVTTDGSRWVANQTFAPLTIADERLAFDSDTFGTVELMLDQVRGILFMPPENDARRDLMMDAILDSMIDQPRNADIVMLENGDQVTGLALALDDDQLTFQTADVKSTMDRDQIVALVLNPALTKRPPQPRQFLLVGTRDGSRLVLASLTAAGRGIEMKTVGGLRVATDARNICFLQPLGGRATYLSDLEVARYRHQPYLSLTWPYRRDRNVLGGRLRTGGKLYEKGIGVHSNAGLTYRLDQPYRRLESLLGIDDATAGAGSVVVRIYTDNGSGTWQLKFTSKIVRGGQAPLPISADISGAKRLSLIVDAADHGDQQDHANFLDARLVP